MPATALWFPPEGPAAAPSSAPGAPLYIARVGGILWKEDL